MATHPTTDVALDVDEDNHDDETKSNAAPTPSTSIPTPSIQRSAPPPLTTTTDQTDLLASFSDIAAARSPIADLTSTLQPTSTVGSTHSAPKTRSGHAAARAAILVADLQQKRAHATPSHSSTSSQGSTTKLSNPIDRSPSSATPVSSPLLSSSSPHDPPLAGLTDHHSSSAATATSKTRRQALQSHTPSHPTQGIAKHTEYDPATGQNVTTTKVYLICRHDCGCKRRGSDLSLLTAPRACSSRGARYVHCALWGRKTASFFRVLTCSAHM